MKVAEPFEVLKFKSLYSPVYFMHVCISDVQYRRYEFIP